jgi:uncharacterized membrane protein
MVSGMVTINLRMAAAIVLALVLVVVATVLIDRQLGHHGSTCVTTTYHYPDRTYRSCS